MNAVSELICQYCSHRHVGQALSSCAHCGAPLRAAVRTVTATAGAGVSGVAAVGAGVAEKVTGKTGDVARKELPRWLRMAAGAVIAAIALVGVLAVRSCGPGLPEMPKLNGADQSNAVSALPALIRSGSSCERLDAGEVTDKCVMSAGHLLLSGGIAGGKDLTFYAELASSERLKETVSRWRAAGATVVADGPVFAAIGPSATVWYADTRTGLRLETGTFTGRAAAQTFLNRAGLTR
ncbi:hypothetical protein [Nocardia australiensis]|uniref:hypothetical protein n=1 Tax=Nocardia australiensis TaxID=2887191 RepID=UPI001D155B70|nr:hypothetical protein [Nocardia australiensis]